MSPSVGRDCDVGLSHQRPTTNLLYNIPDQKRGLMPMFMLSFFVFLGGGTNLPGCGKRGVCVGGRGGGHDEARQYWLEYWCLKEGGINVSSLNGCLYFVLWKVVHA